MGDVVRITERNGARRPHVPRRARPRVTFFFDLASPWTYLAAERAERLFGTLRWRPAAGHAVAASSDPEAVRAAAEQRAAALRMPLVWPDAWPWTGASAMRVAAFAAEQSRAAPFVLAAGRLAFCGGYDLDDPETIAEAAAAAGICLDVALAAARDESRDAEIERVALRLAGRGATALPAVDVGRALFCGEARLQHAAAALAAVARPAR